MMAFWARVNFSHFQYFIALLSLCRNGKGLIWSWQSDKSLGWNMKLCFQQSLLGRQLFAPCYYLILYQHHKLLSSSNCGFQSIHHGFTTHLAQNCTLDFVVFQWVNHPARPCRKWMSQKQRMPFCGINTAWGVPHSSRVILSLSVSFSTLPTQELAGGEVHHPTSHPDPSIEFTELICCQCNTCLSFNVSL